MRAFVSDQSSNFNAKVIDGPPGHTVVASLDLPPGSWVVFATVALAGNAAPGTTVNVQTFFELGSQIYSGTIQCDFSGYSLQHGTGARHGENLTGRMCGAAGERGSVPADDDNRHRSGIGYPYYLVGPRRFFYDFQVRQIARPRRGAADRSERREAAGAIEAVISLRLVLAA